jgi:hypothetical protein
MTAHFDDSSVISFPADREVEVIEANLQALL